MNSNGLGLRSEIITNKSCTSASLCTGWNTGHLHWAAELKVCIIMINKSDTINIISFVTNVNDHTEQNVIKMHQCALVGTLGICTGLLSLKSV